MSGILYIVPTPIGNLKDVTLRALEVLKKVDAIICEDTRRTGLLLNHYQIKKTLIVLNDYNEAREIPKLLLQLQNNNLALVSDAGTPLISDPGYKLVRECLAQNIPVDSLPGASSILPALTLSGLPPDKFFFLGYFPEKPGHRITLLKTLKPNITYIIFVAPHKLVKTLENMKEVLGDIEIVLAKELTKIHQSVKKQTIEKWLEELKSKSPKGEYIMLFTLNH
ncbi:16S rRNA (cytidine(1402)-2'-O)-methyltransferase [Patescibacteria group bacterium]|nr:16S rRNA (cytidine(1402)-2'-O)-methyltransferase [Patescibacteria group bacterium]